ncbi:unnamed protein product [Moneuplotes crassus]|uniref:serine--tRNA ligase n=1 Tax=Euplotes crassus TaxID=5936 RepID=A0AAD1XC23_EUPCR|nr:unnamed protein product [Moneuplotes crassus]
MPIDINLFRKEKGGDPEIVRKSELQRCRDGAIVDEIIGLDENWRKLTHEVNLLKKEKNAISKTFGKLKKEGNDEGLEEAKKSAIEKTAEIEAKEQEKKEAEALLNKRLNEVGNILDETVPQEADEEKNPVERTWGEIREIEINETPGRMNHHHLMKCLDMYDPERGSKVMGSRGYFLKGFGVLLNQALINYAITFLMERKYNVLQPPYFIKQEVMEKTCEIGDFEENLYQIENNEAYLIATSEQPISAMHSGEWLQPSELPLRYCGYSSCFRKEAGSSGRDVWGIFRVHQFDKIEQFVVCKPEESNAFLEEMITCAEEFWQSLEIPYRVVTIVGGALNNAAAKKYDLEGWFPGYGEYRELVSCSNCTDYQSRALDVKFGTKKKGDKGDKNLTHMLNATLCATGRAMCAIVENYQTEDGIRIPTVLQPFLGGRDFIPYDEKALKKFMDEVEKERAKKNKGTHSKKGEGKKPKAKEEHKQEVTKEEEAAKKQEVDPAKVPEEAKQAEGAAAGAPKAADAPEGDS